MSAPRSWARRIMLSALAGSGLTVAGFGGPIAGGALAAEGQTGTTATENPVPPVSETDPQASTPGQEESASSRPGEAGGATGGEGGAGETGSNTTSTAPAATPPSSTTPSSSAPSAKAEAGPTVVVQRTQQTTPGRRHGASRTGSGAGVGNEASNEGGANGRGAGAATNGPSTAPAGSPNGVAPAPQTAGGEFNSALAALLTGSTVSAQALDFYRIPLFLLPVYQAAAFQYDVPWQILAAINEIETNYGADLSVSTAGALGWMQFMPGTWLQYGVDATNAGYADPYNPVDAIFAAARYLHAADASHHLRAAIFAYNHSQEYVESVLLRARLIASYPRAVIGTLTGLVDGRAPTTDAHLAPGESARLAAEAALNGGGSSNATAGAVPVGPAGTDVNSSPTPNNVGTGSAPTGQGSAPAGAGTGSAATGASSASAPSAPAPSPHAFATASAAGVPGSRPAPPPNVSAARAQRAANAPAKASQLIDLLGAPGAPVVAVEDGRIEHLGHSHALGRYLVLRDIYGDIFTYAGLGSIAPRYRPSVPRQHPNSTLGSEPSQDPIPVVPASAGHQRPLTLKLKVHAQHTPSLASAPVEPEGETAPAGMGRVRLFAHPRNPIARASALRAARAPNARGWQALRAGSIVAKGTVLGHLDTPVGASAGRLRFAVRPAGDAATIDPQPLLQNWRQLGVALHPKGSKSAGTLLGATAGDALVMSKGELERAVLADVGIGLDACARRDVASGAVDKRVLAALTFLSRSGLQPTVAAVHCRRGGLSPSGLTVTSADAAAGVSADAALRAGARAAARRDDRAVDITAINGIPLAGHQGSGSTADMTIRTLLTLRGQFAPHLIVSLMKYPDAPATRALSSAWNHIRVEFLPMRPPTASLAQSSPSVAAPLALAGDLNEAQWSQLIGRIAGLPKPTVASIPSSAAIRDPQAAPTNRGLGARRLGAGG